jgi:hypothetical protein
MLIITDFNDTPVWWSSKKTYKNAITNELFLYTSAVGYLRTQNQTYLDNAKKVSTSRNALASETFICPFA